MYHHAQEPLCQQNDAHCSPAIAPLQALAYEVACNLGLDLGHIKIKRFADGEIYVQVQVRQLSGRLSEQH